MPINDRNKHDNNSSISEIRQLQKLELSHFLSLPLPCYGQLVFGLYPSIGNRSAYKVLYQNLLKYDNSRILKLENIFDKYVGPVNAGQI